MIVRAAPESVEGPAEGSGGVGSVEARRDARDVRFTPAPAASSIA
jgi:hypothetical protein